ncbi:hypothetical protein [Kamptonema formosum]|uniref:hypothetical protein n=1 Tax=Kamptonema formosum TaxID=331992 RepID=UPI0004772824|nr:hypothetical protein [Oscillatoria sp. PCC 10802]
MTTQNTGTSNEQYDLVSVLYHALEGAETYQKYVEDAQQAGDSELADFFQDAMDQSRQCADRAKQLLSQRMSQ